MAGQVETLAPTVGQKSERCDVGGRRYRGMAIRHRSGYAAAGHQLTRREGGRHQGLELVRSVACTVSHNDFVAHEQGGLPARDTLQKSVLADAVNARQQQVARARLQIGTF